MGIKGLLKLLRPLLEASHITIFSGTRVGIDAIPFIYQSMSGISNELANGDYHGKSLRHILRKLLKLSHFGVKPVLVFDGDHIPVKAKTHEKRRLARNKTSNPVKFPGETFTLLVNYLRRNGVDCIVAPYEADAQLAYLCKINYISAVITVDSDLVVYGCPAVVYDLKPDGHCSVMRLESLKRHPGLDFSEWSQTQFLLMSILAGCDYLQNCKNIGIKKAYRIVDRFTEISHILLKIKCEIGKLPENYEVEIYRAYYAFLHHRVYCPVQQRIVHLNEINDPEKILGRVGNLDFLGGDIDAETAVKIANGELNPRTMQPAVPRTAPRTLDAFFPRKKYNVSFECKFHSINLTGSL